MYEYKMVQIPPDISVKMKKHRGTEAAVYLEQVVNKHAAEGWEFYRIDTIGVALQPGIFAAILGKKAEYVQYYVITLRKEK